MKKTLRLRFWLETVMAGCSAVLTVITIVWRDWLETVFGLNLDNNTGAMEWFICSVLLIVAVTLFVLARYEWRRTQKEGLQYE